MAAKPEPNAATGPTPGAAAPQRASWLWGRWSRLCATITLLSFAVDQSHKLWMLLVYRIKERGRVPILPFVDVVFVLNRGVSYGLFPTDGQTLLAVFALLTAVALWIWVARAGSSPLMVASVALIMGGALGNALDRMLHGGVVDYISMHAMGYYWYVFNIADAVIVAGVVGLLYESWRPSRNVALKADQ